MTTRAGGSALLRILLGVGRIAFSFLVILLVAPIPARADNSWSITLSPRVPPSPLDELTADGRPTPAAIAVLRSHARGREVRLGLDGTLLNIHRAQFDSLGIAFVAEPARSPIPWGSIKSLETRRSHLVPGIVTGTLLFTIAGLALADAAGPDPGPGILIVFAFPPTGALLGGIIGAAIPRWRHEWPPAARARGATP
jgi:hypothetical protein